MSLFYFACFVFGLTVLMALLCIITSMKFLLREYLMYWHVYNRPVVYVKEEYQMETLKSSFAYTDLVLAEKIRGRIPFDYFSTERIVDCPSRLQHMIEKEAQHIGMKMLQDGLIEVSHTDHDKVTNFDTPYRKSVHLVARIFKKK